MQRLLAAALLVVAPLASAGPLIQVQGRAGPAAPRASVFTGRPAGWAEQLGPDLGQIEALYGVYGAAPVLRALAEKTPEPADFARLPREERAERILKAGLRASELVAAEALAAAAEAGKADPSSPEYAVLFARLQMLNGPLRRLVPDEPAAAAAAAFEDVKVRFDAARTRRLEARLARIAASGGLETLVDHALAELPRVPSALMTPSVARLRKESGPRPKWDLAATDRVPKVSRSIELRARLAAYGAKHELARFAAQKVFVPARDAFRWAMGHAGQIWRKYVSGREMDRHTFRFAVVEGLFKKGDFRASFGHPLYEGDLKVMSPLIFRAREAAVMGGQTKRVGRDLVVAGEKIEIAKLEVSPMLGVSGMSFPQLSAQSHLSLLYIALKLAKEQGVSMLQNTGEGGPGLHLALLQGDAERAIKYIVDFNVENGRFARDSAQAAQVVGFVDRLMRARAKLFAEFTDEDLARSKVVAQFGPALNGIRGEDGFVDFDRLAAIAEPRSVAMVQFKLKQAAKRGAKVDPKKVDDVVAALRDIRSGRNGKSPELNPDFSSYEDIAALVLATKIVARKPVSLKFGVGDVADMKAFLTFLRDANALPDHIQLDGAGLDFSPGSGNAPPGADTSLPSTDATIVVDALLKSLGVRDQVFLETSGDVLLPIDAVEKLALGADGVSAARCWMAMGLGCAMVKACAEGACPYGIAARSDSFAGLALDPAKVAPKGHLAAANWQKAYLQTLAEAGLSDWREARGRLGLAARSSSLRVKDGRRLWTLDFVYSPEYAANLLRGALTREQVEQIVFAK